MKKVLLIAPNLEGGGAERVLVNIANEFYKNNIDVSIALSQNKGVYFDILNAKIPVYTLNASSIYEHVKKLPSLLLNQGYTHIFTINNYQSAAIEIIKIINKKLSGVTSISCFHYDVKNEMKLYPYTSKIFLKFLIKIIIARANNIVAITEGNKLNIQALLNKKHKKKVLKIYNPAYNDTIYELSKAFVPPYNISNINLVAVGRLVEVKDYFTLINAIKIVHSSMPNIMLHIVGNGHLQPQLMAHIKQLQLENIIILHGFQQNPFPFILNSHALVLSSVSEGLPTVLIEAMALGIKVISTNCSTGPTEIINNIFELAPIKNENALAQTIIQVLNKNIDAVEIKKTVEKFHAANSIKKYINLLN
jgi:glycosyltransferase involved in cell wall biosynthesis